MGAHDDAVAREFASAINRASLENESNTPDLLLADAARRLLEVLQHTIKRRDEWYAPAAAQQTRDAYANGHVTGYRVGREDATREIVAALRERADRFERESVPESAAEWLSVYVAEVVRTLRDLADEIERGEWPKTKEGT